MIPRWVSRGGGHTAHLTHRAIRRSERVEFECGATGWPVTIDPRDALVACSLCIRGTGDPVALDAVMRGEVFTIHG